MARQTRSKKSKPTFLRIVFRLFFLVVICAILALGVYTLILDHQVKQFFSQAKPAQPNHVYARPQVFSIDSKISIDGFMHLLNRKSYRKVTKIDKPGDYAVSDNLLDVYLHASPFSQPEFTAQPLRLTFSGNTLINITSHVDGKKLSQLAFQPELIGSLKLGQHEDRIYYALHDVPVALLATLLAMEDRSFYHHYGVDPKGILRAVYKNLTNQGGLQGGSTLTQQLVKNIFLTSERSFKRKAKEALMAFIMEFRYSKSQILTLYINEIFLGQSGNRAIHGFALASEFYFGRPLHELAIHEIALLVGMIPAPSYYNPIRYPERALNRRNLVLSTLVKVGVLKQNEALAASKRNVLIKAKALASSDRFPAFFDYLNQQLSEHFTKSQLQAGGLKLYTTLNSHAQRAAQSALHLTLTQLEKEKNLDANALQGAVIIIDPKRAEILAMVGDRNPRFVGFNRAVDASRPIGSLIKPFIYLHALEQSSRYSLATLLSDAPLSLEQKGSDTWRPQNYDKKFKGPISLYKALAQSRNIPTIRLGLDLGLPQITNTLKRLGLQKDINLVPASLLGAINLTPLEMTQLYQPIANEGKFKPLLPIIKIHDVYKNPITRFHSTENQVIEHDDAYLINYALQQVIKQGTAQKILQSFSSDYAIAGKTGTTDNYRDSWFVGYNNQYLTLVWVGRDNNLPTKLSGSSGALRVWINIMQQLNLQPQTIPMPNTIKTVLVDSSNALLANENCENTLRLPFKAKYTPKDFSSCTGIFNQLKGWFSNPSPNTQDVHRPSDVIIEDRSR